MVRSSSWSGQERWLDLRRGQQCVDKHPSAERVEVVEAAVPLAEVVERGFDALSASSGHGQGVMRCWGAASWRRHAQLGRTDRDGEVSCACSKRQSCGSCVGARVRVPVCCASTLTCRQHSDRGALL